MCEGDMLQTAFQRVFVLPFLWQVDSFQEYVKPELNPQLSDFCVKLTGITQVGEAQLIHIVVCDHLLVQRLLFC